MLMRRRRCASSGGRTIRRIIRDGTGHVRAAVHRYRSVRQSPSRVDAVRRAAVGVQDHRNGGGPRSTRADDAGDDRREGTTPGRPDRKEPTGDADILALARRAHAALPEIALQGIDIIREAGSGKLFVLEANPGGNTWIFSKGAMTERLKKVLGVDRLTDQVRRLHHRGQGADRAHQTEAE